MTTRIYEREDTFSLGVCNGCQLFALLGWVPWPGIADVEQPRFIQNASGRFESRFAAVTIEKSPAVMLEGMERSTLGIWVAHGEGRAYFPEASSWNGSSVRVLHRSLVNYLFSNHVGIGMVVRYSGASVDFENPIDRYEERRQPHTFPVDLGGFQVTRGLRLRF